MAPNSVHYTPSQRAVTRRTNRAPRFVSETSTPRAKKLYVPGCVVKGRDCSISARKERAQKVRESLEHPGEPTDLVYKTRVATDLTAFEDTVKSNEALDEKPVPQKLVSSASAAIDFAAQTDRPPVERQVTQDLLGTEELDPTVSTKVRRIHTVDFNKMGTRQPVFQMTQSQAQYDVNPDVGKTRPLVGLMNFNLQPDRPPNLVLSVLNSPQAKEHERLYHAWTKTTAVSPKGKLSMFMQTPRDDLMYRTVEAYKLNVPLRQSAESTPRHGTAPARTKRFTLSQRASTAKQAKPMFKFAIAKSLVES